MNNREKQNEIKKALENDLYSKIESVDVEEFNNKVSTEKLANILDGYLTQDIEEFTNTNLIMDDETVEDLVVISDEEVELIIDETEMMKEYNENFHRMGADTIMNALNEDVNLFDELEKANDKDIDIQKLLSELEDDSIANVGVTSNNIEEESEFTSSIISPENIELDADDILEEQEIENKKEEDIEFLTNDLEEGIQEFEEEIENENKSSWGFVEILLVIIIVLLLGAIGWMLF